MMTITRVTCRWEDRPGAEPAWYCESWSGAELVEAWYAVYAHDDWRELRADLMGVSPGAEIEISLGVTWP